VVPDKMVIEKVVLNPHLDARTFAMPGARARPQQAAGLSFPRHRASAQGTR
jgi:hypothetical protein